MEQTGLYIYGVIASDQDYYFNQAGIQEERVYTVGHHSLAAVVSKITYEKYLKRTRKHILKHQKVIEHVMQEHDTLPVRFGTIANHEQEIRNLLARKAHIFKEELQKIDHKIEVSVKGSWNNMEEVFKAIPQENDAIRQLMKRWAGRPLSTDAQIKVGELVEQALKQKKQKVEEEVLGYLSEGVIEYRINKHISDEMFFNASFMLSKDREKEFDHRMEELDKAYGGQANFKYIAPLPLFSFVNISIQPEDWER